jgi:type IV pilus assembly protein PilW
MTAAQIEADANTNWDQVIGMRVDLLLRSQDGATEDQQTLSFNGATVSSSDHRLRKVYSSNINIRNRSMPAPEGL